MDPATREKLNLLKKLANEKKSANYNKDQNQQLIEQHKNSSNHEKVQNINNTKPQVEQETTTSLAIRDPPFSSLSQKENKTNHDNNNNNINLNITKDINQEIINSSELEETKLLNKPTELILNAESISNKPVELLIENKKDIINNNNNDNDNDNNRKIENDSKPKHNETDDHDDYPDEIDLNSENMKIISKSFKSNGSMDSTRVRSVSIDNGLMDKKTYYYDKNKTKNNNINNNNFSNNNIIIENNDFNNQFNANHYSVPYINNNNNNNNQTDSPSSSSSSSKTLLLPSSKYVKKIKDKYSDYRERASSTESINRLGLDKSFHSLTNSNNKHTHLLALPESINEVASEEFASQTSDLELAELAAKTRSIHRDYSDLSLPNSKLKNNKYVNYLRNAYAAYPSNRVDSMESLGTTKRQSSLIRPDQSFIRPDQYADVKMPSTLSLINSNGYYNSQIDKIKEKFAKITEKSSQQHQQQYAHSLPLNPAPAHLPSTLLPGTALNTNTNKNTTNSTLLPSSTFNPTNRLKAYNTKENDNLNSKFNMNINSNTNNYINFISNHNISNTANNNNSSNSNNNYLNKNNINTTLVENIKTTETTAKTSSKAANRKYQKSKTSDLSEYIFENESKNIDNDLIDNINATTTSTSASSNSNNSSTKLDLDHQNLQQLKQLHQLQLLQQQQQQQQQFIEDPTYRRSNHHNQHKSKSIKSILKSPSNPNEKSICFDDYVNIIPNHTTNTNSTTNNNCDFKPVAVPLLQNYLENHDNDENLLNYISKNRIFVKSPTPAREIPLLEEGFNESNANSKNNRNRFIKKKPSGLRSKSVEFSLSLLNLNEPELLTSKPETNLSFLDPATAASLAAAEAMHSVSFEDPTMPRPSLMRQNAFAKSLCDSLDTFSIQQQQQKQQEQQNDQAMLK